MKRATNKSIARVWQPRMYIRGFVVLFAIFAPGCSSAPNSGLPTVQMTIGSRTYTLEIANTLLTQQRGLMKRDSLPADHGMIFVFAQPEQQNFWMHDTRFDLDIIYITADGHIDSIKTMKAYDETSVPSAGPVKWAIELNAAQAALTGVKVGDPLTIPDAARNAAQ